MTYESTIERITPAHSFTYDGATFSDASAVFEV